MNIHDLLNILGGFKRSNIHYANIEIHYEDDKVHRVLIAPSSLREDSDDEPFKIDFDNINDYI